MKRRVLEKLGVTATEISIAQVYLAREEEASGFDKSAKKKEAEARLIMESAQKDRQNATEQIKKGKEFVKSTWKK